MHAAFEPLLDPATVRGLLAPRLPEFLGADVVVAGCEVVHARRRTYAKAASAGRTFLTVSYRVGLGTSAQPDRAVRSELLHGRATLGEPPDLPARLPGVLSVAVPPVRLELRRFPDDAALSQLAVLADPDRAGEVMPFAARERLGAHAALHVRVASFRPGERCTLAYAVAGAPRHEHVYAKAFADAQAGALATRIAWLADCNSQPDRTLLVPRLLGYDATLRTVWQEGVAGTPPAAALAGHDAARAIDSLAAALAELHSTPSAIDASTRLERVAESERKVRKLAGAYAELVRPLDTALAVCGTRLATLSPERYELRHGDAHLGQFLLAGARVAMFDCDELARGDLEQDLAALVVELEDAARAGRCGPAVPRSLLAAYSSAPLAPRAPDPELFDFHYRLQRIDRAYRDWWRRGAAADADVRRSIALAAEGAIG